MKKSKKLPSPAARPAVPAVAPEPAAESRRAWWLAVGLLLLAGLCAHLSGLNGRFLLDDEFNIEHNEGLHSLHQWREIWQASDENFGVAGRPVLNFSFALNYAFGGLAPRGYHWINLVLHLAATLVLWASVRRTLRLPGWPEKIRTAAAPLALAVGLVWTVHPLQTNTVTYVSQRAELLMSLFYLFALYGLLRHAAEPGRWRWPLLAILSGWLGIATKEPIVTAPVLLFLFDWSLLAGTAQAAWRQRWRFHLGLASLWLILLANLKFDARGYGFGLNVTGWQYLLTESKVLCRYAGVVVWPPAMVFDYGQHFARSLSEVWPWALLVLAALAGVIGLWRRDKVRGFALLAVFLLLAPTSSFIPLAKMPYAESRLYLPLALLCAVVAVGLWTRVHRRVFFLGLALLVPVLIGATIARNRLFADGVALWRADLRWCPDNDRLWNNLGKCHLDRGEPKLAETAFREAVRLKPDYDTALNNIGVSLERQGRNPEAEANYRAALRLQPFYVNARSNLAHVLMQQQKWTEAIREYEQLLLLRPNSAKFRTDLGFIHENLGHVREAENNYRMAVEVEPGFAPAHNNLGSQFYRAGRYPEALREYQIAVQLDPGNGGILANLANALQALGRDYEAQLAFRRAEALSRGEP